MRCMRRGLPRLRWRREKEEGELDAGGQREGKGTYVTVSTQFEAS
jgi:hypothetical protein